MSLLEKICKELGVEVGEEWEDNSGDTLKLTKSGLMLEISPNYWEEVNGHDYRALLNGELRPVWIPKIGEKVYLPEFGNDRAYSVIEYNNEKWIDKYIQNGIARKTKKEAIKLTKDIINFVKGDK